MSIANKFIKTYEKTIGRAIGYIRDATSYLTPEDDWVEGLRKRIFVALDPYATALGRPLTTKKGKRDYFTTANASADAVEKALMPFYQRNTTSTRKYRIVDGKLHDSLCESLQNCQSQNETNNRQWADGSFVYDPEDTDWQHHVFIFGNGDGTTDLYGHKEASAEHDPYGHVTEALTHGDPDGIARKRLDKANITFDVAEEQHQDDTVSDGNNGRYNS